MGVVIRQGITGSTISYIGAIIGAVNFIFLFPKFLSADEIGLVRVLFDVSLLIATFAQLGLPTITDKFFPFFNNTENKHDGFLTFILSVPLIGMLLTIAILLSIKDIWVGAYQEKSPLLIDYFYYFIPLSFFVVYFYALEGYTRSYLKIAVPIFLREILIRIFMGLCGLLYYMKIITFHNFVITIIGSYALCVIILIFYIKHLKVFFLTNIQWDNKIKYYQDIAKYSGYSILVGASSLISNKIDVLILGAYSGLGQVGIYSIAFFIGSIIEIPRRAISQISAPLLSKYWKDNNIDLIQNLYIKTAINQCIVGTFALLLIWCNIDFIFSIIPNASLYATGKYVVLIIGFAKLVDMSTGINSEIILNSPYFNINFIFNIIISFFTVTLNYLLIPILGLEGAALSSLVSIIVFNTLKIYYLWIKLKIHPFSYKILYVIGLALILAFFNYKIEFSKLLILDSITTSLIITLIFSTSIYLSKISVEYNTIIDKIFYTLGNAIQKK